MKAFTRRPMFVFVALLTLVVLATVALVAASACEDPPQPPVCPQGEITLTSAEWVPPSYGDCPVMTFSASHQIVDVDGHYIYADKIVDEEGHWGSWRDGSCHGQGQCQERGHRWNKEHRHWIATTYMCPVGYNHNPGHSNCRQWVGATYQTETFGPIDVSYAPGPQDPNHCHLPPGSSLGVPAWAMDDYNDDLPQHVSRSSMPGYWIPPVCYVSCTDSTPQLQAPVWGDWSPWAPYSPTEDMHFRIGTQTTIFFDDITQQECSRSVADLYEEDYSDYEPCSATGDPVYGEWSAWDFDPVRQVMFRTRSVSYYDSRNPELLCGDPTIEEQIEGQPACEWNSQIPATDLRCERPYCSYTVTAYWEYTEGWVWTMLTNQNSGTPARPPAPSQANAACTLGVDDPTPVYTWADGSRAVVIFWRNDCDGSGWTEGTVTDPGYLHLGRGCGLGCTIH